ncbi:hypothetical protein [Flindersiella endophytica]
MAAPGSLREWPTPDGASLDAWLAGWEHRIAGRPADRWTAHWNTEMRYDNRPHDHSLTGRDAALALLRDDWEARRIELSVTPGTFSLMVREHGRGPSIPSNEFLIVCYVTAEWSEPWSPSTGLRTAATVATPGELGDWLHQLAVLAGCDELPEPASWHGPAYDRPVEVRLSHLSSFELSAGNGYWWRCDVEPAAYAESVRVVPALARYAGRTVSTVGELAGWLSDAGSAFTGSSVDLVDSDRTAVPGGVVARVTKLSRPHGKPYLDFQAGLVRCVARPENFAATAAVLLHPVLYQECHYSTADELAGWLDLVGRPVGATWWTTNWSGQSAVFAVAGSAAEAAEAFAGQGGPASAWVLAIGERMVKVGFRTPAGAYVLAGWPGGPHDDPGWAAPVVTSDLIPATTAGPR